ncbi:transposase [Acinetobacter higginsii]|uniref:transposase n=1 Tax=Acinetobacter higginsii TaxID=70347 RepID=UPI003B97C463
MWYIVLLHKKFSSKSKNNFSSYRDKSSIDWFFCCKLNVLINKYNEIFNKNPSNRHTLNIKILEQLLKSKIAEMHTNRSYLKYKLNKKLIIKYIYIITTKTTLNLYYSKIIYNPVTTKITNT